MSIHILTGGVLLQRRDTDILYIREETDTTSFFTNNSDNLTDPFTHEETDTTTILHIDNSDNLTDPFTHEETDITSFNTEITGST